MPALEFAQKTNKNNWFFNELKSNRKFLLQTTPLLIGYCIFLSYFIQNDFFPNMDIFNWTSLIIASFILGMIWFFILLSFLIIVSYYWNNLIVNDKILLKKIAHNKGHWLLDDLYLRKVTAYYLSIPLLINNLLLGFIACLSKTASVVTVLFFSIPIILGIITVTVLYKRLHLPCKLCFKYLRTIIFLIFISSFFCSIFSYIFQDNLYQSMSHSLDNPSVRMLKKTNETTATHLKNQMIEEKTVLDHLQSLKNNIIECIKEYFNEIIFLWFIFLTTMFINIITVLFLEENKWGVFAMIISFFYLLFFLTNVGKIFPEKVVKILNVGNYQASHVYLKLESCQRLKETQLFEISKHCSLDNIKVLWDIGEHYVFKIAVNGDQELLSLDAKEIIAVLKSKKSSPDGSPQPTEALPSRSRPQ